MSPTTTAIIAIVGIVCGAGGSIIGIVYLLTR